MHLLCLLKPKGLRGSITCFVFPSKKNIRELMNFWSKDGILIRLFLKKTFKKTVLAQVWRTDQIEIFSIYL